MFRKCAVTAIFSCLLAVSSYSQTPYPAASPNDWEEINFEFSSAVLSDGFPSLLRLADLLKAHPGYRVRVEGNTDNLGSARSNERLGLARANAVKDFLVKYGAANCVTTAVVGGTTTCQTVVRLLDLDLSGSSSPAGNNPLTFFTTSRSTGQSYSIQHRRRRPFSSLNCSATTSLT